MNVALRRKRGKAQEVIAEVEGLGRRQPLAAAAGGFAAVAASALAVQAVSRRNGRDKTAGPAKHPDVGGTKAHSYGRDNPSGPGYNWPPEPVPVG